jgi:hypothetical protein
MEVIIKKLFKHMEVIIEDNKRVSNSYKKNYPNIYLILPLLKVGCCIAIFFSANQDHQFFQQYLESIVLTNGHPGPFKSNSWTFVICIVYLSLVAFEFIISILVIKKANHPVKNFSFQTAISAAKAVSLSTGVCYCIAYGLPEPSPISNFYHTKMPGGRGYDFEVGDGNLKAKGYLVLTALGRDRMLEAIDEHGPSSKIVTDEHLKKIISNSEYTSIIREKTTVIEKSFLGISIVNSADFLESTKKAFSDAMNNTDINTYSNTNTDINTNTDSSSSYEDIEKNEDNMNFSKPVETFKRSRTVPLKEKIFQRPVRRTKSAPSKKSPKL